MAQSVRTPVNLGSAGNYVVLSEAGITDVPPSSIVGNIGASPITGAAIHVTCAEVTGTISAVDAAGPAPCSLQVPLTLGTAIGDMSTAYTDAAGRTVPDFVNLGAGNISGMTLAPGLYKWGTDVIMDSTGVTLSGGPNAVWIFQISGNLTLASAAQIKLVGGARAVNIFWQIGGGTGLTLGTGASFSGTALSATAVIMNTGSTLLGRAFAVTNVTLAQSPVTSPGILVGGLPGPVAPQVTSTVPANSAVGVGLNGAITATFSEAMAPGTITSSSFTVKNGVTSIAGTVSYVGVTATFTPTSALPASATLTGTITTAATDPAGVPLASNYVWTFNTGAAPVLTPPTVSSTVPANGAVAVPVGNALSVTFSEAMNPATINTNTFLLKQGATVVVGTVVYAGVTATFTPSAPLSANLLYTATITTGVADLFANTMAANYVWSFTTAAVPVTLPTVSSTVPTNGAAAVPVGNALSVTFSTAMNPLTVTNVTFFLKQGGVTVPGTVVYSGVTATFTPTVALAANLTYIARVTTGVADLAGNNMASDYIWSFTTGAAASLTAPTVSSTVPGSGAGAVPINSALAVTFSEAMNPLTITTTTISLAQGATNIPGTVTYSGVTAAFTPASSLSPNLLYTATVSTGVLDLAGNALATAYTWSFTSAAAANTTSPTVSYTVPQNGSTAAPTNSALSVTFSKPMNPLTITTTTIGLKQGQTTIAGTVTYSGLTATFTPASPLTANLSYTAIVTTGATDLAGDPLLANYLWGFTAALAADTTPPTIISTVPASGATAVPLNTALAVIFSKPMNPLTITLATIGLKQGGVPVSGTLTYAGVTATFRPTVLKPNLPYTATVTTGVTDLAGNALAATATWAFTTGSAPNAAAPTVISTGPSGGALLVTTTSNVAATFSAAMDPLTISTASFSLMQGATPVPGAVTSNGALATFRPTVLLQPNTQYTATLSNSVADLTGNPLAGPYVWSFNTGTGAVQTDLCLANFAIIAGSGIVSSGPTVVTGNIGVPLGTLVTGFPPGTLSGAIHVGDAVTRQALADVTAAYADAVSRSLAPVAISGDIGGQTFTPGLYQAASSLGITAGDLTLDAKGNAGAVFIFQAASTLNVGAGRQIILINGAQSINIFWQVGASATLGAGSAFNGSILANQSITLGTEAGVYGRLAAITGTVTLVSNIITSPPPTVYANGVVNAATSSTMVAPGSLASLFGVNVGSSLTVATSYALPNILGGVGVQIGALPATLLMTSCGQVNMQIPWETTQATLPVSVNAGNLVSLPQAATVVPFAPGIFTVNQMGTGQGAIEIAPTPQLAAPAPLGGPVTAGQYIAIFCTGLGPVTNQPGDGYPGLANPLSTTLTMPVVMIGNVPAQVSYSGLAPTYAGLYQVNAIVPPGVAPGNNVTVTLTIGGVQSNTVTIAVQ